MNDRALYPPESRSPDHLCAYCAVNRTGFRNSYGYPECDACRVHDAALAAVLLAEQDEANAEERFAEAFRG